MPETRDPQSQLNTRAIEIASEARGAVTELGNRMEIQRREYNEASERLRGELRDGFKSVDDSVSKLHGRLDQEREQRFRTWMQVTGASALSAVALISFLFGKLLGWI